MSELAIGIDLGTSNSCVSIARNGKVEVLPNQYGEMTTASVVAFHEDGTIEVGNHAKANIVHDPVNTICSAKRLIGRYYFSEEVKKAQAVCAYEIIEGPQHGVRALARDEEFSLPEISAMVLREMKQIAEAQLGETVTKAVITVPAYFNDNQRQATKDAGRIAGLEVLRILNEPTAAALAYGFGRELNQRVAVYDLGGGTFDVSVLEIGKDIFEVLSTCGDTFLGGDDFDDRLIDLLADEFVAKEGINLRLDPFAFEKIKVAAENAKKTLSREDSVEIRIPDIIVDEDGTSHSLERVLSQEEYCALVQDLVMRTFKVCDEALQQADLTTRDLDGVILVGGPTRLPQVRQAVGDYFQQELKDDVDPDQVVAKGAAIHAASLCGGGEHTGEHDAFLLDVTPLDLRIGVAGGLAEPVIERNTPVPIEQTRRFATTRDFQDSVKIRVFQGGARQSAENEVLGEFEFSGFKSAPRGDVAIDVTFAINADGIVNVTAFDPESGEKASTSITLSSGLSGDEIESILEDDKSSRVQAPEAPEGTAASAAELDPAAAPDVEAASDEAPEPLSAVPDLEPEAPALEADEPELEIDEPELEEPEIEDEALDLAAANASTQVIPEPAAAPEPEVVEVADDLGVPSSESEIVFDEPVEPVGQDVELDEPGEPAEIAEIELDTVAPDAAAPDDELGLDAEAGLEIDDDELLELADVVEPEDERANAVTDVHIPSAEEANEPTSADEAFEEFAQQVDAESTKREDLFDTNNVDLSAGTREDH